MRLSRLFRAPAAPLPPLPPPSIPGGKRVYAIGDVHGRLDLLDRILATIAADDAGRGPAETVLVFLGDLVDRGPDSAGVVARALDLRRAGRNVRFIKGNHEESFLRALDGGEGEMRFFTRIGGQETILSYGVSEQDYLDADYDGLRALASARVPAEHRTFLANFERFVEIGDYLFVHAGIRPDVPLAEQKGSDLRWIRNAFLDHAGDHGHMIVHGHTISDRAEERPNRIGIDTGAFESDRLTALGLEGTDRWFLDTAPPEDEIPAARSPE